MLAARFGSAETGLRALAQLRSQLDVGHDDVSVAPLGGVDQPVVNAVLLAGRFRERRLPEVRRLIEVLGGVIVADVDEARTRRKEMRASGPSN